MLTMFRQFPSFLEEKSHNGSAYGSGNQGIDSGGVIHSVLLPLRRAREREREREREPRQTEGPDYFLETVTVQNPSKIAKSSGNCVRRNSGKKKAHKHKLFGPVALGTPRECPRDKPGLSPGQSGFVPGTNPGFLLIYTAEAQLVPGTNPVCPWDIPGTKGGRKSLCVKSLCASFVP